MISLRFYIINSLQYWGLVKSMGVADGGRGHSILIIGDFKAHKIFKMSIDANTTISDYIDHFTRIVIGEVPHVVRSGRASTSCIGSSTSCVHDLTSATFQSLVMEDTDHVILVVHYAPWCLACVHIWPHLYAISSYNNSIIKLMRLNGETNDVSWCHTPSSYPSVALYKIGRKSKPIWYPNDMTINVENLLAFISREGEVSLMMEEREEDVRGWEGMGWLLWETAERERKSLEEKNIKLALEVNRLRSELNNQNKKEETKSILAQVDSLLNQLMDTSQSDKVTKKEMNNNRQSDDVLEAH
jgi:thiol-disulfide isomerase/thioredoxin